MSFVSYEKVRLWQEISLSMLKKYTERYYTFRKREWELPHLEYRELAADDPNFLQVRDQSTDAGYRIRVAASQTELIANLNELKTLVERDELRPWAHGGIEAVWSAQHLYRPLLYLNGRSAEISPAPLNWGERKFVADLAAYHAANADFFGDKQLYLLRNLSKGRGIGFFEAGNFHPDFMLWMLHEGRQYVSFVDPKGIRQLPPSDDKEIFRDYQGHSGETWRSRGSTRFFHRVEHTSGSDDAALAHEQRGDAR